MSGTQEPDDRWSTDVKQTEDEMAEQAERVLSSKSLPLQGDTSRASAPAAPPAVDSLPHLNEALSHSDRVIPMHSEVGMGLQNSHQEQAETIAVGEM